MMQRAKEDPSYKQNSNIKSSYTSYVNYAVFYTVCEDLKVANDNLITLACVFAVVYYIAM